MTDDMVLGIIGCPKLADEIVHAVRNDVNISKVMVVRSEDSPSVVRKLAVLEASPPVVLIEPEQVPAMREDSFSLLVMIKPMALNEDPPAAPPGGHVHRLPAIPSMPFHPAVLRSMRQRLPGRPIIVQGDGAAIDHHFRPEEPSGGRLHRRGVGRH